MRRDILLNTPADCFLWPSSDCPLAEHDAYAPEEEVPTIDLSAATRAAPPEEVGTLDHAIGTACKGTGFFQVVNHGVDEKLIKQVHEAGCQFFELPVSAKLAAAREAGNSFGFAGLSAGRFKSKCPWKETLSLQYSPSSNIRDYLCKIYQSKDELERYCSLYSAYCEAMDRLGKQIIQLIARSLGLPTHSFNKYFDRGFSIFRMNMYPPSKHCSQVLGTGPHTDPCALTILHQDEVGGLQIYKNSTWLTVRPRIDALVVSIGDTFQVLCNHRYKSSKHRAVIHASRTRQSLVYFINPSVDELIKPIPELSSNPLRPNVEFRWGQLLEFTQRHYRTDANTLEAFEEHLQQQQQREEVNAG